MADNQLKELVEAIKERHSVRQYSERAIEEDKVALLKKKIDECNEAGNLHIQFLADTGNTYKKLLSKVMGLASAPSVILCAGPDDETLDERVGYYGEQIVLYAQQLGLNTCWAGTFNHNNSVVDLKDGERLVISIAIGYGENQGRARKSKTIDQVVAGTNEKPDWFNFGVEMALLAPTAINQQKFEFVLKDNDEVEVIDKGGVLSKVDQGIVKYHFEVGSAYAKSQQ